MFLTLKVHMNFKKQKGHRKINAIYKKHSTNNNNTNNALRFSSNKLLINVNYTQ